jgi:hypothetical protein
MYIERGGDPDAALAIGRQVGNSDGERGASGVGDGGVSEVGKSKGGGEAHGERYTARPACW